MLLRTLLLLLCVSSGLCATLSLIHLQAKDEDTPAQDVADVLDNVVEALDGNTQDPEATPDDPSPQVDDSLLETMIKDTQPGADEDTPVADGAPAEEVVAGSDNKTEDVPIEDPTVVEALITDQPSQDVPVVETKVAEAEIQDQPSQDVPVVEALISDQPSQDVPVVEALISDQPSQDVPVVETKVAEAAVQEEDNEIKPIQTEEVPKAPEETQSRWSFNSIRSSFQNMNGYFDSLVELVGGRNGVCEYRCRYGDHPEPRPGYQIPEPNGCSSSLVGFQVNAALDLGVPAMTQCCNQLDTCYDTCGSSKYDCDSSFRTCLHEICSDLKKSLGFGTQVQTCESMADGLFNTVWTLGCRPYMNSQRAACMCFEEEKDEL